MFTGKHAYARDKIVSESYRVLDGMYAIERKGNVINKRVKLEYLDTEGNVLDRTYYHDSILPY